MRKAVIYARVSSREQQEEGYSIEAQLRLLKGIMLRNAASKSNRSLSSGDCEE